MEALKSVGKLTDPYFGNVKPDDTVNVYFNMSSNGKDERGPWNSEPTFRYIADPLAKRPADLKPGVSVPGKEEAFKSIEHAMQER